ncbi:MAG TPA: hypothetical protein DCL77_02830 [Prolixibacteraceae bacterium]|jgi:hypothetical protein|nr:hypothetical protein [Prolixibacteraceae bacterium]
MKNENLNKLMTILLAISGAAILVGAIFKLQHYPHGESIIWGGFVAHFCLSSIELNRLRKIITKTEPTDYEHTNR